MRSARPAARRSPRPTGARPASRWSARRWFRRTLPWLPAAAFAAAALSSAAMPTVAFSQGVKRDGNSVGHTYTVEDTQGPSSYELEGSGVLNVLDGNGGAPAWLKANQFVMTSGTAPSSVFVHVGGSHAGVLSTDTGVNYTQTGGFTDVLDGGLLIVGYDASSGVLPTATSIANGLFWVKDSGEVNVRDGGTLVAGVVRTGDGSGFAKLQVDQGGTLKAGLLDVSGFNQSGRYTSDIFGTVELNNPGEVALSVLRGDGLGIENGAGQSFLVKSGRTEIGNATTAGGRISVNSTASLAETLITNGGSLSVYGIADTKNGTGVANR